MQLHQCYQSTPMAINKLPVAMDSRVQGATGDVCLRAYVRNSYESVCIQPALYMDIVHTNSICFFETAQDLYSHTPR